MAPRLKVMAEEARITVLTGARQVGKSTLLAHELGSEWAFFSMDDIDVQAQVLRDPDLLLKASPRVVLDEAHLVPAIFPRLKQLVDKDRSQRFVLSGSANLLLLSHTTESLAGRAEFLHLLPLSARELAGLPVPEFLAEAFEGGPVFREHPGSPMDEELLAAMVWKGGMPEVAHRQDGASLVRWREGYIRSYLERDLRQLSQIDNLPEFKRLMSLAALRCGRLLNQSEVARDAGLSQPTAHRYLGILDVSEQTRRIPSFQTNASSSIVKSPKLMWTDSGLASFAAGFLSAADLLASREWGAFLECHVYNQLRAICETWDPPGEILFWRTRAGTEVDFVVRRGRRLVAIEVKAGSRVRFEDTAGLQEFMRLHSECRTGILLHSGNEDRRLSDNLFVVPLSRLCL
jgi:uncharacterized protein